MVKFTPEDWKVIVAAIAVIVGSNFTGLRLATDPDARPDPATGTDLRRVEKELREHTDDEISRLELKIRANHGVVHLTQERECARDKAEIKRRLTILEQDMLHCKKQIDQHNRR